MKIEQLLFCDQSTIRDFLPFTFTRPSAELRAGILTFAERWERLLGVEKIAYNTADYLSGKYPKSNTLEGTLSIYANFLPTPRLLEQLRSLKVGESITYQGRQLAFMNDGLTLSSIPPIEWEEPLVVFEKPTDLFTYNDKAIDFDFELLTKGRTSQPLSSTNGFLGKTEDLFIEEGAVVEYSTLNTKTGKIYIGKNAEIMEGCHLRGPIVLCEGSKFNLGAKVYGATTIGPHSKVGGEVNNIVIFGYSNKGHDGFVGNSVIGEWCNLGADTNSSNLKNNYASVKLWNYKWKKFIDTGLQFCGLIMGDHSKTAINTQLNTGTVVGVAANIFKSGFPPNLVNSFSWGGMKDDEKYNLNKAFETIEKVMARRKVDFTDEDKSILSHLYNDK